MHQPGNPVPKFHKSTIRLQTLNRTLSHKANLDIGNLIPFLHLSPLTKNLPRRKHQPLLRLISLDHPHLDRLIQKHLSVLNKLQSKPRRRNKTTDTLNISNGTPVNDPLHNNIQHLTRILKLLQPVPGKHIRSIRSGKKNIPLTIIPAKNHRLNLIPRLNSLFNIKPRHPGKLLHRNKTLSIKLKVKNNPRLIHTHNSPGDNIPLIDPLKRSLQLPLKILHRLRHIQTSHSNKNPTTAAPNQTTAL